MVNLSNQEREKLVESTARVEFLVVISAPFKYLIAVNGLSTARAAVGSEICAIFALSSDRQWLGRLIVRLEGEESLISRDEADKLSFHRMLVQQSQPQRHEVFLLIKAF